jgi:hypothetical protein
VTRPLIPLAVLVLGACAVQVPYRGGARAVEPSQLDASWLRAAPTPVVVQEDRKDCGLAALAMIAGAWGERWPVAELARRAPPTPRGLALGVLRDLARAHGLEAFAIRATRADLARELAAGRPVLLGLVLPHALDRARSHFEVAIALHRHDGAVVTIDPATGKHLRRSPAALDVEWKAAGYAALVVTGQAQATHVAEREARRHRLVEAARARIAVVGTQPLLVSLLANDLAITDEARGAINEQLVVFQMRLDEASNALDSLEHAPAVEIDARARAVEAALERLEIAREASWDALDDAERVDRTSS